MTKFIGRQFNVGIGKESSRGTAHAAQYWLPWESLAIDDVVTLAKDETTLGVIEQGVGQEITTAMSKATLAGHITDKGFGLLLMAALGTDTVGAVQTGVKDHVFTVAQSAQHPSLTLSVVEPNSASGAGFAYTLGMIEELQMSFELNKYSSYKATLSANKGASTADTTAYVAENRFRPQDGQFKLAADLASLGAASAITIRKADISIKKNTEEDLVLGTTTPADRLNKQFGVTGSLELIYNDRTMVDTYLLADLAQAMQLVFANTAVTIGASSNPTLTIRLAKVKFEEVARKIDNKGVVTQAVKFQAFYSIGDTKMIDVTLRNTVTSAY